MSSLKIDPVHFKKIAARNTVFPMALAIILTGLFIGVIFYLLSVTQRVTHSNQVLSRAHFAIQLMIDAETSLRGYVISRKNSFLEPWKTSNEKLDPTLNDLTRLTSDNAAQQERLQNIRKLKQRWSASASRILETSDRNLRAQNLISNETAKKHMDSIRNIFSEFVRVEESLLAERTQTVQSTVRYALLFILTGGSLVGGFLAFYSRKQLRRVTEVYSSALLKEAEQNEILQQQAWIKAAQAELVVKTRGDRDTISLCQDILTLICHLLDAKVGVFYLVDSPKQLKLAASFALSPGEIAQHQTILIGNTLVGQAFREKRLISMNPAPTGHLRISSVLGESDPTSILIAPAMANDTVRAVIELALLRPILSRDYELLQSLSETISFTIISAQNRSKLRELLEESQRQAEELQTQQEELRVSNEELEQQTTALRESHSSLAKQQAELEHTNQQLEEQTRELEFQKDQLTRTQERVLATAEELRKSSQYKSEFLANMSHELRTPLNSSLIMAKLLLDNVEGNLTAEQLEFAKTIYTAGNDLLILINDILDLSKVEAGKLDIRPEKVNVSQLITKVQSLFQPLADEKQLALKVIVDPSVVPTIETDPARLEQILKNLISNAIKFTQKGQVEIRASQAEHDKIRIDVKDTGLGIAADKQEVIFEAFKQADGTINRKFGGTGLGLSISRELTRLLEGEILLQSILGEGSTFTIILPLLFEKEHQPDPTLLTPLSSPPPKPLRTAIPATLDRISDKQYNMDRSKRTLLIVEDDAVFTEILVKIARERAYNCLVATSAEEACQIAFNAQPDGILLDIHLPDHSGISVLDRLKNSQKTRHIPVHIISADDQSQAAMKMGAIGYLLKPTNMKDLQDVFSKLEEKVNQKIRRLLIVEDDPSQILMIKKLMSDEDIQTEAVNTGEEALRLLKQSTFDCMVLDLNLPDYSGFDILDKISEDETYSHPPVIVYTARDLNQEEEIRLQKLSKSIIVKGPQSSDRLLSEISLFLHKVESQLPFEKQKMLREFRSREKTFEGRKILIADDDARNIFALGSILEKRGALVEVARNGKEALGKLKLIPDIDLVIMDVMMPEMDGYTATQEIRKERQFQNLPVIVVTAKAMNDDRERSLASGANDYLSKPIDVDKLVSLIRVWLPKQRRMA